MTSYLPIISRSIFSSSPSPFIKERAMAEDLGGKRGRQRAEQARRIQRAWRNSLSGIDLLRYDVVDICAMLPSTFYKFSSRWLASRLRQGCHNPSRHEEVSKAITEFGKERHKFQSSIMFPICTALGSDGLLPQVHLVMDPDVTPIHKRIFGGSTYLTPEIFEQYLKMPKSLPKSQEQLDVLVQELCKLTDIIPWSYLKDGCYARAQLTSDFLRLCGMPKKIFISST